MGDGPLCGLHRPRATAPSRGGGTAIATTRRGSPLRLGCRPLVAASMRLETRRIQERNNLPPERRKALESRAA